ncbi:hypothetical protein M5051_10485, partial [Neisseria meningitidis]|nr:hypothetical protein [Neisseria meningitidis]
MDKCRLSCSDGIFMFGNFLSDNVYPQIFPYGLMLFRQRKLRYGFAQIFQTETFAKFLSLPTAETQTQVFGCFRPKYLLILPKYPLNPPRIPDNQASGPPFRRQRAHLACWRL